MQAVIPSDRSLCGLLVDSYDVVVPTLAVGDMRYVVTPLPGLNVVSIPGTRPEYIADWIRDLAIAEHRSRLHPQLGVGHDGCMTAAEAAIRQFLDLIGSVPYAVVAHSLGGGVAVPLVSLAVLAGRPPVRLVTCGAMQVCVDDAMPKILKPVPGLEYVHEDDVVPDLPPEPYGSWRPDWAQLGERSSWIRSIEDHAVARYQAAMPDA